jgi:hypothetical protein
MSSREQEAEEDRAAVEADEEGEEKEVVEFFELPPIFIKPAEDEEGDDPGGTTRKIHTVAVYRKRGTKDMPYLGWRPIEELHDLEDLLRLYGAGTYMLQGRGLGQTSRVIKVAIQTVGDADEPAIPGRAVPLARRNVEPARGEFDVGKLVGTVMAAVTPLVAIWKDIDEKRERTRREDREREEQRRAEERERDDRRNQTMIALATARSGDYEAIIKSFQAQQGQQAGGSSKAYKEGMEDSLALLEAIKSGGLGQSEPDFDSKFLDVVGSILGGAKKANEEIDDHANGVGGH